MTLHIITPFWNTGKLIEKCINSIKQQVFTDWVCYLIDDYSDDDSLLRALEATHGNDNFQLLRNTEEKSIINCYDKVIQNLKPTDVCVNIDADDWLANNTVLSKINKVYEDDNTWVTYGSYKTSNGFNGYCVPLKGNIRTGQTAFTHLRTFRAGLFQKIKYEDLLDRHNKTATVAVDITIMTPIAEMAGAARIKFLKDILYIYNVNNYNSISKIRTGDQLEQDRFIRKKKPYKVLASLAD